jgi:hypothetical protein
VSERSWTAAFTPIYMSSLPRQLLTNGSRDWHLRILI